MRDRPPLIPLTPLSCMNGAPFYLLVQFLEGKGGRGGKGEGGGGLRPCMLRYASASLLISFLPGREILISLPSPEDFLPLFLVPVSGANFACPSLAPCLRGQGSWHPLAPIDPFGSREAMRVCIFLCQCATLRESTTDGAKQAQLKRAAAAQEGLGSACRR